MRRLLKWACSALSCLLCCCCVAGIGGTLGQAARRHHQVGRLIYVTLLVATTALAWIMYNLPAWVDSAHYLAVLPNFRGCNVSALDGNTTVDATLLAWLLEHEFGARTLSMPERLCFGALSAHRVLLALFLFHALFALIMIGATGSRHTLRYELQHAWWLIKLSVLAGLLLVAFLLLDDAAIIGYSWLAFGGALVFLAVQVLLLVEFAHTVSNTLSGTARRGASGNDTGWRCLAGAGGLVVTVAAYAAALAFIVLAYAAVDAPACALVSAGTTTTLALLLFISLGAFLAMRTARGGLLPASIVCAYGAYLTWSAFSPLALHDLGCLDARAAALQTDGANTTVSRIVHFATLHDLSRDAQHVIILGTAALALAYTAFRTSSATAERAARVRRTDGDVSSPEEGIVLGENDGAALRSADGDNAEDDESGDNVQDAAPADASVYTPPPYSFSWFHVMLALAAMYAAMVLTGWNQLHTRAGTSTAADTVFVNHTGMSAGVKLGTAWLTMLLYLWTVYVPFVRSRRCCTRKKDASAT